MPSSRAISVFEPPDAEANTICARRTNPCGAERDRTHSIRLCRSVSLNTISRMRGRPICSPTMIAGSSMKRHHVQYKLFVGHDTSLTVSQDDMLYLMLTTWTPRDAASDCAGDDETDRSD